MNVKTVDFIDDIGNPVVVAAEQVILIRPAIKNEEKDGQSVQVTMQDVSAIFLKNVGQPVFVKVSFADAKRKIFGGDDGA